MKVLTLSLLCAAVLAAPATAQRPAPAPSNGAPVLQSGDAVRITVWRKAELSGEFDIAEDGTIKHPLYRDVRIGGLAMPAAESRVREFLARYETTPQFVIEPLFRVAVGGEVRQPNLLRLPAEATIAHAVAMAGGATERGRLDRVTVLRDGRALRFDLTSAEPSVAAAPIRSGDQILVARRGSTFRDVVAPTASILGAAAVLLNVFLN